MDITLVLVTLLSLTLAGIMTGLAWRLAREDRRRSDARVAALAAEIHVNPRAPMSDLPLNHAGALDLREDSKPSSDLFVSTDAPHLRSRLAAVLTIGVLGFGGAAGLAVMLSGSSRSAAVAGSLRTSTTPAAMQSTPAPATDAAPLELIALTHELDADRLIVRGVVRNPVSGADVNRLTTVVFLFNHDGGLVASERAEVGASTLAPGAEAPFVVTIPGATDVGRYRVSFRTEARVLPHVDRRDRAMAQAKQR